MPGHSPGARIHDGVGTSSADEPVRRAAVRRRVHHPRRDRGLLGELRAPSSVCSTTSCAIAVSRPSRVGAEPDALDRRRAVAGEREHLLPRQRELAPAGRRACAAMRGQHDVRARRALRAEAAADVRRDHAHRARARGRTPAATVCATRRRALGRVVERQRRRPPRRAIVACGSIGLLWYGRRRVRRVDRAPRPRRTPASKSPSLGVGREVRVDLVRLVERRGGPARSTTSCGSASYSTRDEPRGLRGPSRGCRRRRRRRSARGRRPAATAARASSRSSASAQPRRVLVPEHGEHARAAPAPPPRRRARTAPLRDRWTAPASA